MPQCAYHPNVETNVRCVECDRYICTKDFVSTPVGYKCKQCARQLASARRAIKPRQIALAVGAAGLVGIGGAYLLWFVGFYYWLGGVALGIATGEAARRASGGHRGAPIAGIAGLAVVTGAYTAGLGDLLMVIGAAAAVIYVMSNRL